jgi:hypothetical protein
VCSGTGYSVNFSVLVSKIATLLPRYSAITIRSSSSMFIRRARPLAVGSGYQVTLPVLASIFPM